jgi:hypothetical protein
MDWIIFDTQPSKYFMYDNLSIKNIPSVDLEDVWANTFKIDENVIEVFMDHPIKTKSLIPLLIVTRDINAYKDIKYKEIYVKNRRTYWENPLPYYKFQTLKDGYKIVDTSRDIKEGISVGVSKALAVWDYDDDKLYQYTPLEWKYNFHNHYNFEVLEVNRNQTILPKSKKLPKNRLK